MMVVSLPDCITDRHPMPGANTLLQCQLCVDTDSVWRGHSDLRFCICVPSSPAPLSLMRRVMGPQHPSLYCSPASSPGFPVGWLQHMCHAWQWLVDFPSQEGSFWYSLSERFPVPSWLSVCLLDASLLGCLDQNSTCQANILMWAGWSQGPLVEPFNGQHCVHCIEPHFLKH